MSLWVLYCFYKNTINKTFVVLRHYTYRGTSQVVLMTWADVIWRQMTSSDVIWRVIWYHLTSNDVIWRHMTSDDARFYFWHFLFFFYEIISQKMSFQFFSIYFFSIYKLLDSKTLIKYCRTLSYWFYLKKKNISSYAPG